MDEDDRDEGTGTAAQPPKESTSVQLGQHSGYKRCDDEFHPRDLLNAHAR